MNVRACVHVCSELDIQPCCHDSILCHGSLVPGLAQPSLAAGGVWYEQTSQPAASNGAFK